MTAASSLLTRKDIRRFIIRRCLGPAARYLLEEPSARAAGTLTYAGLANLRDSDFLKGGQAYALVSGSPETVYVASYAADTGVVTLNTSFSGMPDAGTVEVIDNKATFDQLHEAIDSAVAELSRTTYDDSVVDTLMAEDDRFLYDLPEGLVALKQVAANIASFANDRFTAHTDQNATTVTLSASTQRIAQPLHPYTETRLKQLWLLLRIGSGSPTGTLRFRLRADGTGPASVLATGATIDVATLPSRFTWKQLTIAIPYTLSTSADTWWELDLSGVTFAGGTIEVRANLAASFPLGGAWESADSGATWVESGGVGAALMTDATNICFVALDDRPRPVPLRRGRGGAWDVRRDSGTPQLVFSRRPPGGTQLILTGQVVQGNLSLDSDVPTIDGGLIRDLAAAILMEQLAQGNLSLARLAKDMRTSAEARAIRLGAKSEGAAVERN